MAADLAGVPVALPSSERARALIAWLALHPGPNSRAAVAAGLWPEADADRARANLRTAVWAIRASWGDAGTPLEATRSTLALIDVSKDVDDDPSAETAADELLPELTDDWVLQARAELADRRARRLTEVADRAEASGAVADAVRWTRRLTELRRLDESAHRALVERLLLAGERAEAVLVAREFAERLHREVGVRPSPATRAVHARARGGRRSERRTAVFGRSEQLTWLTERWREAANGRGQAVLLAGEAGIGKTTLLAELVRQVAGQGGHAAAASGIDVAGETPFAAWLELARSLAGAVPQVPAAATWPAELNRLSPGLGARLGHPQPPSPATAPELERLRVFEALLRLVEWSCAERPTLLAVDDAHRADRASLRLAAYVGRRLSALPVLLVLVRRDGTRRPDLDELIADLTGHGVPVHTLAVPPISDAEVGALARSLHDLDGDRVAKVIGAAEGNPLLAVEAARTIVAGSDGPPPNLRAAVTATLSRLPESTVALVELLAAAGRPLWPAELRRLDLSTGADPVTGSDGLLARRDGRLGFRHELLRAAVYSGLPDPTGLHDRLADGIAPTEHVERAHHLARAGRARESGHQLAAAAAQARAVGALDEAAELLQRAVAVDPADGELWLELEEVYAWANRQPEMEAAWAEAIVRLPAAALAEAWCRRGRQFRTVTCHPAESLLAYRTARSRMTDDTDPALLADALVGLAWGDAVAGSGAECERLLAEAAAVAELTPQLSADALEIRMQGLIRQARFAEAAALVADPADPVVRQIESFPDRAHTVLVNAACALVCDGRDEPALALIDRAYAATAAVTGLALKTLAARAQLLARLGRHDEAARAGAEVQAWADRIEDPVLAATTTHDRGLLALRAGRYAEAADLIGSGLDGGAEVSRVSAGLIRAEALALAGDPRGATGQLRAALQEPVGRADQAWALLPRVAWVQALIAYAEGNLALTRRRLAESGAAWHRVAESAAGEAGDGYLASLVDLGRPPIIGLVEPARELARIEALTALVDAGPAVVAVR